MTDDEVIQLSYEHYSRLFPKICPNCGKCFATLRQYILETTRIGSTISYDAEVADWDTAKPIGAASLANCSCGTTLALTTKGIPLETTQALLQWIKVETERRGVGPRELLDYVRDEVRKRALADPGQGNT